MSTNHTPSGRLLTPGVHPDPCAWEGGLVVHSSPNTHTWAGGGGGAGVVAAAVGAAGVGVAVPVGVALADAVAEEVGTETDNVGPGLHDAVVRTSVTAAAIPAQARSVECVVFIIVLP